jgi:hypothetical protein
MYINTYPTKNIYMGVYKCEYISFTFFPFLV